MRDSLWPSLLYAPAARYKSRLEPRRHLHAGSVELAKLDFCTYRRSETVWRPWMRCHVHVENLPAGVMDHEEHVQRSKRYGLNTKEVALPDGRRMLPQE